jgi:uncharacterized cofD-like protein
MSFMKRVVTIGGGTGNFTTLSGLNNFDLDLTAIVSMADDGGSTGILRDELGVLPPGDVRQCLVALSESSKLMRDLMNYRFDAGGLQGHSFGNLLLSSLEKITGSFEEAIEEVGKIIKIKGRVLPVTTNKVTLKMLLKNGKLLKGQHEISISEEVCNGFTNLYLYPSPKANPRAIDAIMNADMIVLGPGSLYGSLIPNLLTRGISRALIESKAKKVFVVNLMNKHNQTPNFKVSDYLKKITEIIKADIWNYIIVNNGEPSQKLIKAYAGEGDLIKNDLNDRRVLEFSLISDELKEVQKGDLIKRNLIRHDSKKLAEVLVDILNGNKVFVFDLDNALIDTHKYMREGYEWEDLHKLKLRDGVKKMLISIRDKKILVTRETIKGLQKAKLEKTGIYDLFDKVIICNSNEEKLQCFEKIDKENNGVEIWAIGDRIDSEIRYANMFGWRNVLLRIGKYKNLKALNYFEIPEFEVESIVELKDLIFKK